MNDEHEGPDHAPEVELLSLTASPAGVAAVAQRGAVVSLDFLFTEPVDD